MFLPKLCYIVTYSRYIFNKIFCPCYLTLISKYGLYLIGWDRIWWDRALLQDTLRCALTIFFQHNFRLFFFFCNCFYLFKLFNPTKWVISKHPYKTHLWKRWGKEKKRSTYDVISQISLVAFVNFSLYTPVLWNCKWSKHKTY